MRHSVSGNEWFDYTYLYIHTYIHTYMRSLIHTYIPSWVRREKKRTSQPHLPATFQTPHNQTLALIIITFHLIIYLSLSSRSHSPLRGHPYTTSTKIHRKGGSRRNWTISDRTFGGEGGLGFPTFELFMRNSWLLY